MHELSIVASIVDSVTESLAAYPGARVKEVRLRVGAVGRGGRGLAAVLLRHCDRRTRALEGSKLVIKILPVVMHCDRCDADVEIESLQSFRCPRCGEPVSDLRQGRELEIDSIEIEEAERER